MVQVISALWEDTIVIFKPHVNMGGGDKMFYKIH